MSFQPFSLGGKAMTYMNKLFRYKSPYALEETNELFLKAMQENCKFQYENCED